MEFKCPECDAKPHQHGKGGKEKCVAINGDCDGFVCECFEGGDLDDHGESFSNPCFDARCYHCGWRGQIPILPKKLQAWEKKALEAGWIPPAKRAKELKL